jgi:hypothetical protein
VIEARDRRDAETASLIEAARRQVRGLRDHAQGGVASQVSPSLCGGDQRLTMPPTTSPGIDGE